MLEWVFGVIGIIYLILAIILYLAILETRDNTRKTKELLYFIARYQIDNDKTKWNDYRERREWDNFEEMEDVEDE
ncbi:MAG: hypothetical protein ACFFKA_04435 [Candidatus Thorarchaeota archaeon]